MEKETLWYKWEGKSSLAGSSSLGEVVLVFQLSSPGIKREITSDTQFIKIVFNNLRWEPSGHRESRPAEGCGSTYELHRWNKGFESDR